CGMAPRPPQPRGRRATPAAALTTPGGGGGGPRAPRHGYLGSVATLGHRQGVTQVFRLKLHGFIAWLIARGYHLMWVPTLNHKARVLADWSLSMFFHADTIPLSELEHPGKEFMRTLDMKQSTRTSDGVRDPGPPPAHQPMDLANEGWPSPEG